MAHGLLVAPEIHRAHEYHQMPFVKSLAPDAGPPAIYVKYPDIFRPWSEMSQAVMNGPSPLDRGERELIFAFAAGVIGCEFVYVAHSEVAYALGIERGLLDELVNDPELNAADGRLRPLLLNVRKLCLSPGDLEQADVDAVFDAGWNEEAFDHSIAITGRAKFMQCVAQGYGFAIMDREKAAKRALRRVEEGYVNLYPAFRGPAAN